MGAKGRRPSQGRYDVVNRWRDLASQELEALAADQLLRTQTLMNSPQSVRSRINGQDVINFSSNDYLGWACDPQQQAWLAEGARRFGVGSGASHWVVGHSEAHAGLEAQICEWLGVEAAALFATGYLANLAAVSVLASGRLHHDRLNHASLLQAGQLAGYSRRYPHLNYSALEQRLVDDEGLNAVITDGVFSMDGDQIDAAQLSALCQQHDAFLMVDDAHGLGVLGQAGRGCTEGALPDLLMGTLGKAVGAGGAFVAGSHHYVEWIRQKAKPYTYTTALSPALAYVADRAIQRLVTEPEHQARLTQLIAYFRQCMTQAGLPLSDSHSAIQPIVLGSTERALAVSEQLRLSGLWVSAIRPPTVPAGTARLRVALSAGHSNGDVDQLIEALCRCLG